MLNINHESLFKELKTIESQLDMATLENCVSMIQLLSNSLKIVDIKKRPDGIVDEEWEEYLSKTYELASYMLKLIQNYSNRLNGFLLKKINKPNPELNIYHSNSKSEIEHPIKRVSIKTENLERGSSTTSSKDSTVTMVNRASTSKISPIRQKPLNKGKGIDDSSISDRSNVVSVRKGSTLRKSINIDGTETNYDDDDDDEKYVQSNVYSEDEISNKSESKETITTPLTPNSEPRTRVNSINNINKVNSVCSSPSYSNRNNQYENQRLSLPTNTTDKRNSSLDTVNNIIINDGVMSSSPSNMVTSGYNNGFMNQMQNQTGNSMPNNSNNNNNNYYFMNQNQQFQNQNFMNTNQNYIDLNQNQNFMDPNQNFMDPNQQFQNQNFMNQNMNYYVDSNGELQYDQSQQQNFLQERFNLLSEGRFGSFDTNSLNSNDMNSLTMSAMYNYIPGIEDNEQYQSSEGTVDDVTDTGKDNFIGNYICIKNYQAEMDAYIDLEAGDIVSISEFSGEYALGFNCRTERYGLFPIYDIDSLNGFAIFYRVIADNGPDASKNDAIFVVSEADNDLLLGYNITKGDTGFFTMEQLEVLQFDSDNNPILDENILNNQQNMLQSMDMANSDPRLMIDDNAVPMVGSGSMNYSCGIYPNNGFDTMNYSNMNYYNNDGLFNYPLTEDNNYQNNNNEISECLNMVDKLTVEDNSQENTSTPKKTRNKKVKSTNHQKIKYTIQHYIEKETEFNDKMKATINILKANLEKYVDTNEEILNKVEIGILFKYFPNLYAFSNELLGNLEDCLNKYDTEGLTIICSIFDKNTFNCSSFIKYSENYEYSLDAFERIRKDIIKFDKVERILKAHKDAFHKQEFKDLLLTPINHFVTYKLILNDIKKEVYEDDIYDKLDEEIEYIKKIGDQMNIKVGESIQIRKFFALKKTVMGFPADFISYTTRKLITDFEIMGNVRGTFKKHVYLFNDCVVVVSTNKDAKKKGFEYVLENIIYYKDYDFEKVEQGNKVCIKCVCKNKNLINGQYDSRFKNKRNGGIFKTSKGKKTTYDNSMYLYFNDVNSYNVFYEECKVQKSNLEGAHSSNQNKVTSSTSFSSSSQEH
ncbi:hypothetical protein PIROE2DRAFT_1160 [Piromyces sp. E2]|nr:hypothetical protein PIROE2DRAFT_1160 [Piromyces sp. E2]|eukprot:OUM70631.1 hypothetical protein PIROE2DRAFT_1160 [Piromyces sp. E2]